MPVMTIGPAEFASLLDDYAKDLVKDLPVPTDQATALRSSVRLMAHIAIREKADTFAHRVPRGAWLS